MEKIEKVIQLCKMLKKCKSKVEFEVLFLQKYTGGTAVKDI